MSQKVYKIEKQLFNVSRNMRKQASAEKNFDKSQALREEEKKLYDKWKFINGLRKAGL